MDEGKGECVYYYCSSLINYYYGSMIYYCVCEYKYAVCIIVDTE
jgi:hypothetical protein